MIVRVLGDAATVQALRLGGLDGRVVDPDRASDAELEAALDETLRLDGLGVLLVTDSVAARMRERLEREKLGRRFPLVIEIPARGGAPEPVDDLIARVARMVGVKA